MIGILSDQQNIRRELGNFSTVTNLYNSKQHFPKVEGIFIDWVNKNIMPKEFFFQAAVIENYTKKKIPIVIFDGSLSMTRKEFEWLKKFKVFFFEPALNNRREFSYLPHWLSKPIKRIHERNENRSFELGYITSNLNDKIKSFEKYFKATAMLYPDKKVCYQTNRIDKSKESSYKMDNLIRYNNLDLQDVFVTMIIDSQKNYEIGYIDPYLFYALQNGCLPLLPIEHKFFGNLFNKLVVSSTSELNFFIDGFRNISYIIIDDIVDSIYDLFPEFLIKNVALKIKECLIK